MYIGMCDTAEGRWPSSSLSNYVHTYSTYVRMSVRMVNCHNENYSTPVFFNCH